MPTKTERYLAIVKELGKEATIPQFMAEAKKLSMPFKMESTAKQAFYLAKRELGWTGKGKRGRKKKSPLARLDQPLQPTGGALLNGENKNHMKVTLLEAMEHHNALKRLVLIFGKEDLKAAVDRC